MKMRTAALFTVLLAPMVFAQATNKLDTTGNAGIGTTSPASLLEIDGAAAVSSTGNSFVILKNTHGYADDRFGIAFTNVSPYTGTARIDSLLDAGGSTARLQFLTGGSTPSVAMTILGNQYVGIGTSSPTAPLHVDGAASTSSPAGILVINNNHGSAGDMFGISFRNSSSSATYNGTAIINSVLDAGGNTARLELRTGGATPAVAMSIDGTQHVIIGTVPSVNARLEVGGDIHATGSVNATYQDIAEWVPTTSGEIAVGTVVIVDPAERNHVIASSRAYDTAVAGVISGRPGVLLGNRKESDVAVATTGRVPVMVDATTAPIAAGDLLVTSAMPGTAMKSIPLTVDGRQFHQPGTIIGKALEPLAAGKGTILVLLSLQ